MKPPPRPKVLTIVPPHEPDFTVKDYVRQRVDEAFTNWKANPDLPLAESLTLQYEHLNDDFIARFGELPDSPVADYYDHEIRAKLILTHAPTPGKVIHLFLYPYTRALSFQLDDLTPKTREAILKCTYGHAQGAILLRQGEIEPVRESDATPIRILEALDYCTSRGFLDPSVVGVEYQGVVYPLHGRTLK